MNKKILRTIKENNLIRENMHIVLGLSGGPDSVCLFDVLLQLAQDMNLQIHPVHVNHKFRPGAAEEDQAYVEELCAQKGLECTSIVCDCSKMAAEMGMTSEEAGRKARYDAFAAEARKLTACGIKKENIVIAVAQNANDQCETILFRLMRGAGTDGLAGIAYKREDSSGFDIIRPLLDIKRSEIEKYCAERNLNPRIDHTNSEPVYTRNKIRLELIPFLEQNFNENILETVNRLGKSCAADRDYLRGQAQAVFGMAADTEGSVCRLKTELLEDVHQAVRMRVYSIALGKAGMNENITSAHLQAVEKVRTSASPSAYADLADGFVVFKAYDQMIFCHESLLAPEGQESCKVSGQNRENYGWRIEVMSRQQFKEFAAHAAEGNIVYGAFSGGQIDPSGLTVRTRREGDRIAIRGGSKKLQDVLVDSKVPKMFRDSMLMLALGSEILWIMPSEHFPDDEKARKGRFSAGHRVNIDRDDKIIVLVK